MAVFSSSDGLPKLIEGLTIAVGKTSEDVSSILDLIINKIAESGTEVDKSGVGIDELVTLLDWKSKDVVAKTAQLIAELSKCEAGREKCAAKSLADQLLKLFKDEHQDITVATQVARALGNICYENDGGRKLVLDADGLPTSLKVVERSLREEGAAGRTLRLVAAGYLLNLLLGHEDTQRAAVALGIAPLLCGLLEADGTRSDAEETTNHVMLIFGLLAESNNNGALLDERACKVAVQVLGASTAPEISEMCLELLHGQADDETVKVHLAHSGVCELLFRLLEKHKPLVDDEDTRNLMKMACDLIVLILTGDVSMNYLYAEGRGKVFEEMVSWLSSDDEDLQITGVLAMGNFARTDKHCIQMVACGVSQKLLALLAKNNTSAGDIRLQHALLSALRNLVIPVQNKATVLSDGLVDIIYPMLEIPTFPVVFKLLGTLRMVIDGQESAACELGRKGPLVSKLVTWCSTDDHPGVQGEANRLLAWLIKNSKDAEAMSVLCGAGAVKCLVAMVTAEHAVMQNEALLALALLAAVQPCGAEPRLLEADVGAALTRAIAARLPKEVVANVMALVQQLCKSASLKRHLVERELSAGLTPLVDREELADIRDDIRRLAAELQAP